ncbi:MAG: gfo/Idh/MocA family oxidoreductase [Verrucomicrobiaceae bacterium]|nr:gfo/Idh/MocA family oxidoreductase [Verrucomicrobiaceae bacterium]
MADSADKELSIGIVGAGGIVKQRHMPGLMALPNVRVTAVANSTPASSKAFRDQFAPEAEVFERWEDLTCSPNVDAVWIGATPWLHCDATLLALANGKHVFCQARMARDLSEAGRMWEASIRYPELVTAICPAPQGMAGGELVKKLLAENAIGTPHQIILNSHNDGWLDASKPAHWRQRVDISGLQVLTLGIYIEVLHRWLGDITEVQADGAVVFPQRQGYEVEVPDLLHVLCTFRNGARGSLTFSGVAGHPPGDQLIIYGSNGTLVYDFVNDVVKVGVKGGELKEVAIPDDLRRTWTVERDFVNAIRDPEAPRPRPDFIEGMRYMRVVQAVAVAQDSGEKQRVC